MTDDQIKAVVDAFEARALQLNSSTDKWQHDARIAANAWLEAAEILRQAQVKDNK